MGGCFSVSLSCDQVVNQCSQWLCVKGSYIHNLPENLGSLEKAMGVLKAKRDDVQGRVDREELTGHRRRLAQVQVWLTSILTVENQFNDLICTNNVELRRLRLCGFCSKNLKLSYRYGKRVILMLREIESLSSQGQFDAVTEEAPRAEVEELPIQPIIVGQETMLDRTWNRLMDDKVGIVGLYGMGGVGKTALLTQINNKFSEVSGGFDVVLWIVVSKTATVHKIQEDMGEKLGLVGNEWAENRRVLDIHKVLRRKKFVLLLDDIWEKVDLKTIGVPNPSKENGCKVAFTTRSLDVCGRMGVNDPIEVSCLDTDKAWDLFRKKVGDNTLESHPDIPELARKVTGKCRGLPLALNVIGETMACKSTIQEWHRAFDALTSSASEFKGVEDEILPILKYSYDMLDSEQVKSCFLYCSLFPEDYLIKKQRLIGEGFIDENEGRERALNQGYEILGTLFRACLLEEENNKSNLKMHDVVREMAIWIASDLGEHKERCVVQAGVGLRKIPQVKNWKNVRRMSLMENKIEIISESLDCPDFTTLLLQKNKYLVTISGEFFMYMPRLLVLDLSHNVRLSGFPEKISGLASLRHLDLSWTMIERLDVQELKMLIHLKLESTYKLESINGISNLSSLRTLKLQHSSVLLDTKLMKELQLLEHLEFISVNVSSTLVGKLLLYDPRVGRCIQDLYIEERREESVRVLVLPAMHNLRKVIIWNCEMRDINIEKTPWNKSLTSPCFSNLSVVKIHDCDDLWDLTWLLFAPNLTHLSLRNLKLLKDIISREKAERLFEKETCNIVPFQKLEELHLNELYELKSIYWSALPFQRLRRLRIAYNCKSLKKLPLDSNSVFKIEEFVFEYINMERIEWEDEATRDRFLPSSRFVG